MEQIKLQVLIDDQLPKKQTEPVIALGDFEPSETTIVYQANEEHFGDSVLQKFYRDLIFGRPLPVKLVAHGIHDVDDVLFLALFLDRQLAIHPAMASLVFQIDLARFGPAGLAHMDRDLARFVSFARDYLGDKEGRGDRIKTIVEWLRQYLLEGILPGLPAEQKPPRVVDVGTNGFVVAEAAPGTDLMEGWVELYRAGHLRGVLLGAPSQDGRRSVLGARKSHLVTLDLPRAATVLNEAERAMVEPAGWIGEELWLWGPWEGTLLPPSAITGVLVRV